MTAATPPTTPATTPAITPATTRRQDARRRAVRLVAALATAFAVTAAVDAGPGPVAATASSGASRTSGGRVPSTFVLSGGGWGHGVGMSQYGAQAQALAGRSAAQILSYYYTGTALTSVADSSDIRVQVLGGVTSAPVTVRAIDELGGRFLVTRGRRSLKGRAGDKLTLRVTSDGVGAALTHAGTTTTLTGASVTLTWQGTRDLAGGPTVVDVPGSGGTYRWGRLEATRVGGKLNMVNVLRLHDEYLNGIAEVPTSWASAALQAQAVAARTYAVKALAGKLSAGCACNVYDDTRSQVFRGWDHEGGQGGSRWAAAVRATAPSARSGRVVSYKGKPIDAVYFSSDGGATENSEDVWSSAVPYLRSVPDPWSAGGGNPLATWIRTRTQAQVAAAFGLADVASLDLTDRTAGGSVRSALATSSSGRSVRVSGPKLASRLGLPARWLARPSSRVADAATAPAGWGTALAAARSVDLRAPATVVVAGGSATSVTAEAAVAATLARHLGAPLVLVPRDSVPPAVKAFLTARHVGRLVVVGGTDTVPEAIAAALAGPRVMLTRIAGADRYDTAALVARQVGAPARLAVVAPGEDATLATTVAAAAVAAASGRPLLLVRASGVPAVTAAAQRALRIRSAVCAGGSAELPDAVLGAVPGCVRVGGAEVTATTAALVRAFDRTVPVDVLAVAGPGGSALAGGVAAAALGLPVAWAWPRSAPAATVGLLQAEPGIRRLRVFGSSDVLPSRVIQRLRRS
jgi:stage II sporulation protein D